MTAHIPHTGLPHDRHLYAESSLSWLSIPPIDISASEDSRGASQSSHEDEVEWSASGSSESAGGGDSIDQ